MHGGERPPVDAAAPQRPDAADKHHHHAGQTEDGWDGPVHARDQQACADEDRQRGEDLTVASHGHRYTPTLNGLSR
jgi:hypothetical protein